MTDARLACPFSSFIQGLFMAGFFTNGVCFPTLQEAIDTHYQSQPTFTLSAGLGSSYIYKYVRAVDGSWVLNRITPDGLASTNITLEALNFLSCESPTDSTTQFLNGVELGWGVSSVIVIAFLLRRLRRGF